MVDAAGASVAGADVDFFQTSKPWASWGALLLAVGGPEASAEKLGAPTRYTTDSDGLALLPTAWPSGLIWARTAETEAFVFVGAELEGDLELALEPSVRVDVRIVDTAKKPRPGARMFVTAGIGVESFADSEGRFEVNGNLAAFIAPAMVLDAGKESVDANLGARGAKVQSRPVDPRPVATFDTASPPAEIELVTQAMGLVRIELVDALGRPVRVGFPFLDFVLTRGENHWNAAPRSLTNAGSVIDTWLPSGAAFVASFQDVAARTERQTREGVVPAPNEPAWVWRVQVEGVPEVVMEGRLVNDAGQPLALLAASLVYGVEVPSSFGRQRVSRVNGLPVMTDTEGRFEANLLATMVKGLQGPESWLVLNFEDKGRGTAGTRMAQLELENPGTPSRIQVGDCVMQPPPVLFAGRFVDPSGQPLEGVKWSLLRGVELGGVVVFQPAHDLNLGLASLSDAGERFEVRGAKLDGSFQIQGSKPGYIQLETTAAVVGDKDLVVPLVQAGTLAGTVASAPDGKGLSATLRASANNPTQLPQPGASGGAGAIWSVNHPVDQDGHFEFKDLAPGLYDVEIRPRPKSLFGDAGEVLWSATDVRVDPGSAVVDPRLEGVELGAPKSK